MVQPAPHNDTICALSTPPGKGAIAVLRLSGPQAITIASAVFEGHDLTEQQGYTLHHGNIRDGDNLLDEVVIGLFRAPQSYTGEHIAEISCHGSPYVQQAILNLLIQKGARLAGPGEFTQRAFLNGKLDLSQAEAVADLIASETQAAHRVALHQMRGGFSREIQHLREQLLNFASLVELELDFSEEDVEFADRSALKTLIENMQAVATRLIESFRVGNAMKEGVPVVIAGRPNAGKSTLLNALLHEERALVSDIAGTTRDAIEDVAQLRGIPFRFIDTAGLRKTKDVVEGMGVQRSLEKIKNSAVVLYLFDVNDTHPEELQQALSELKSEDATVLAVGNKVDISRNGYEKTFTGSAPVFISALKEQGLDQLADRLCALVENGNVQKGDVLVTNARHAAELKLAHEALEGARKGLEQNISGELLAQDIRRALHHLGLLTGQVSTDDLLGNIFSRFCIGK